MTVDFVLFGRRILVTTDLGYRQTRGLGELARAMYDLQDDEGSFNGVEETPANVTSITRKRF